MSDLLSGLRQRGDSHLPCVRVGWNQAFDAMAESLLNPTNDQVTVIASRAWAAGNYVSPSVVRAVLAAAAGGDDA